MWRSVAVDGHGGKHFHEGGEEVLRLTQLRGWCSHVQGQGKNADYCFSAETYGFAIYMAQHGCRVGDDDIRGLYNHIVLVFVDALIEHADEQGRGGVFGEIPEDRKSTRLNSSHVRISYAVFCLKKKKKTKRQVK